VYATLGVFLPLASRNPSANRSLIAFPAWSSLVNLRKVDMDSPGGREPASWRNNVLIASKVAEVNLRAVAGIGLHLQLFTK
jgi:hypothetical protein